MSRGGSRSGAGRPGWRRKCEQSLPLDIRRLHRRRLLSPGLRYTWQWTTNYGDPAGSIQIDTLPDAIRLAYQWTPYGGDPASVTSLILLTATPCTYGGNRPWFLCPRCRRRCAVVYAGGGASGFACRLCLRLAYASECEDTTGRLWRKQSKLEARLRPDGGRPKGMHWRTWERIEAALDDIEERREYVAIRALASLMSRGKAWS